MAKRKRSAIAPPAPPLPSGERCDHHDFYSTFLDNRRTIRVALPPDYHHHGRCPVLYMHDGQNLFDPAEAAFGVAWQADTAAARLIHAGRIPPIILVGIANTPDRLDEYTIYRDAREKAGGRGALYARFVLEEVKPFIDANYRTKPDREHTAVAGASLGGLVSLTMAQSYPEAFALCGAVSPSLWWSGERILDEIAAGDHAWLKRMRFWVDMGTKEGRGRGHAPAAILRTRRLIDVFDVAGLAPGRDYYYCEVAGGEHNEAAWSARFDKMLLYFFAR